MDVSSMTSPGGQRSGLLRKWLVPSLVLIPLDGWAIAALAIDGPESVVVFSVLALAVVAASVFAVHRASGVGAALFTSMLPFVCVVGWWLQIEPSNDRAWLADVARTATVERLGDRFVIHGVRNFRYRSETDFDEVWEDREIDLSKVTGVDLFLSYWGSPLIAHTIASWQFEEGPPLAISIETRKEVGESYSAVLGFFRQFELYSVVADELEVVGFRPHHRGEDVYVYRITMPPERARAILEDYLGEVERLSTQPRWYNALTHNCTTTIRMHVRNVAGSRPMDWRVLVNGKLDELGYEQGTIDNDRPFAEIRAASAISERARSKPIGGDFSERIREGVPPRPDRVRPLGPR